VKLRARQILKAYGANPARWPRGERAVVQEALSQDLPTVASQRRAATLDALLDAAPRYRASPALIARIRAAAESSPGAGGRRTPRALSREVWRETLAALFRGPVMRPASALAGAVALGVLVGALWAPAEDANAMAAEFVTLAFGHDFQVEGANE